MRAVFVHFAKDDLLDWSGLVFDLNFLNSAMSTLSVGVILDSNFIKVVEGLLK